MADAGGRGWVWPSLGRMRGNGVARPDPSLDDYNRSVSNQIMLQELHAAPARRPSKRSPPGPSVTTVTTKVSTKKKGKAADAPPSTVTVYGRAISLSRCLLRRRRRCSLGRGYGLPENAVVPMQRMMAPGRTSPARRRHSGRKELHGEDRQRADVADHQRAEEFSGFGNKAIGLRLRSSTPRR